MTYDKIRKSLVKRRATLLGEIDGRDDVVTEIQIDEAEEKITERMDDEVLTALSEADRDEITRIDVALEKIAEGSYGECETCGRSISPARLEAMPDALLCIDCATAAEARN